MATDLSLDVRKSWVAHMRADENLTALVPAEQIFGEFAASETLPFIRLGDPDADSYEEVKGEGSRSRLRVHVFAGGPSTDDVLTIAKRVVKSFDVWEPATFDQRGNGWQGTQIVRTGEDDVRHAVIDFDVIAFLQDA